MRLVTASQMQDMDKQTIESFGIPGLVLMENAGRGAVDFFMETFAPEPGDRVAVFAGRGNNGGDGFVMARYLIEKQIPTTLFLLADQSRVAGDAKVNMDLFDTLSRKNPLGSIVEITDHKMLADCRASILHHHFFIDAIFGTGLNSDVRGFYKEVIDMINAVDRPVFSVDIPSGLHSDTGSPLGTAVKADATATFAFAKIGHILFPGNHYSGDLKIIDIGIPEFVAKEKEIRLSVIRKQEIAQLFPPRSFDSHKGRYGHLLVVAGSPGKTGAAALCANAAMRCGTGLVTLGVAKGLNKRMEPMVIEPMTVGLKEKQKGILTEESARQIIDLSNDKQALALGPGIGTDPGTQKLVHRLITEIDIPMVIDADGLNCLVPDLSVLQHKKGPVVLTPHPGEMARLCGQSASDVQSDRLSVASEFAQKYDVILVLKGAQTIVSLPTGRSFLCPTGNPGMASGGMGDVLTGMIAGFAAQGMALDQASLTGVFLHGLCADLLADQTGAFGFLASDMLTQIPDTIHHHLL